MNAGEPEDLVKLQRSGSIATITLNRPAARNAMTRGMCADIIAALASADADDDVRAIIVTGTPPAFCAGADLRASGRFGGDNGDEPRLPPDRDFGGVLALRIFAAAKLIIGAINGDAVGVGASITLPMDVRVISTSARFGFVQAKRGIVPEGCASWFLPRIVGISRAVEWACSGRLIPAAEVHQAGLAHTVCAPEDVLPTAHRLAAGMIADTPATPVAATRRMLWHALTLAHPMEAHRMETALVRSLAAGPDAAEGRASFLDKRPPRFASSPSSDLDDLAHWWPVPPFDRAEGGA